MDIAGRVTARPPVTTLAHPHGPGRATSVPRLPAHLTIRAVTAWPMQTARGARPSVQPRATARTTIQPAHTAHIPSTRPPTARAARMVTATTAPAPVDAASARITIRAPLASASPAALPLVPHLVTIVHRPTGPIRPNTAQPQAHAQATPPVRHALRLVASSALALPPPAPSARPQPRRTAPAPLLSTRPLALVANSALAIHAPPLAMAAAGAAHIIMAHAIPAASLVPQAAIALPPSGTISLPLAPVVALPSPPLSTSCPQLRSFSSFLASSCAAVCAVVQPFARSRLLQPIRFLSLSLLRITSLPLHPASPLPLEPRRHPPCRCRPT